MKSQNIIGTLGIIAIILSFSMLVPLFVAYHYDESATPFVYSFIISFVVGAVLYSLGKSETGFHDVSRKEGFAIVTFAWIFATVLGALPYLFSSVLRTLPDAIFESMSGFTTVGATVIADLSVVPHSILLWRSLTHWLGGMGIILIFIAILPLLGVAGMQLFKAETTGPTKDKITPRVKQTAKILWSVYAGLSLFQFILLWLAGLSVFDAAVHTFGTIATGGFSSYNVSVGHFNSALIDGIIVLFMLLSGASFALHYKVLSGKTTHWLRSEEFKIYFFIIFFSTLAIMTDLRLFVYDTLSEAFRYAVFQVTSIVTTTGFVTADYELWPFLSKNLLFLLMFFGGCVGSTAGGIKAFRLVILWKYAVREMRKLVHPQLVAPLRVAGKALSDRAVHAVIGFFVLYLAILCVVGLVISAFGYDFFTSFSAVAATLGTVGPGFSLVGPTQTYLFFPAIIKLLLAFCMLLGRLELFTVLATLAPHFWKE